MHAQTYYISSTSGDDRNNGTSPETAWATIDRVNQVIPSLKSGNSILFERGGIFYGSIRLKNTNVRGTADAPITFGAYGEGEEPIISGAKLITNWEQVGENLWMANVSNRSDLLFVNGKKHYPARFPNKGYRTVTNNYSNGFQDNTLRFPDGYWDGATVAFKVVEWDIRRDTVTHSYDDGRIDKYGENRSEHPNRGYGYFFQNHINALDTIGEWVYDKYEGSLTLSTHGNPNEQTIEYPSFDHAIEIDCSSQTSEVCHMVIENLCFQHYRRAAIIGTYGQYLTIRNNRFQNGMTSIQIQAFHYCYIEENQIHDMEHNGIVLGNINNSRIHNNDIRRMALSLDGGQSGGDKCYGILLTIIMNNNPSDNNEITMNRIDSIGYCGISAGFAQNSLIKNNVINHSMISLADGGGIYTARSNGINPLLGNRFIDNIILNTIGNKEGTPGKTHGDSRVGQQHGIYLDAAVSDIVVEGNTVFNSGKGILFNGASNNYVRNNVVFGNVIGGYMFSDISTGSFSKNDIQNNYMYATPEHYTPNANTSNLIYATDIIDNYNFIVNNTIDNNYISTPFGFFATLEGQLIDRVKWSAATDFDLHSNAEPVSYQASGAESPDEFAILAYNPTSKDTVILLDHTYMSFEGTIYAGSIHLQPFKSSILFRCKYSGEQLEAPDGESEPCIGVSSMYFLPGSIDLTDVDTISWQINPPAAGIISVSGEKGNTATIEWTSNQLSLVQLTYSVQMNDGSSSISKPLVVNLEQENGRPPTPTGPTEITDLSEPGIFEADNPDGIEIEWIIPQGVGSLNYDDHGDQVKVTWGQNLLGKYTITYRLRNSCGGWTATALPLYFSFPVAPPNGPAMLCEGAPTHYTTSPYTDMASGFTWVLEPPGVGYLEYDNNEAWVTLSKNATPGKNIVLYYTGTNNTGTVFQSPSLVLSMNALPAPPVAKPSGSASVEWTVPSTVYTAEAGWNAYDWQILPASAGIIAPSGTSATVNWTGGSDHNYAGQVQISYRGSKAENTCGFSDYSPALLVTLLPKPPETSAPNPCAGTSTAFSAKTYSGAASYRWNITPANAGTSNSNSPTATIAWASGFSGQANVSYSVIDAAGRAYTSSSISVNIRALPERPGMANGLASVDWNHPTSAYTADLGGDSYEWRIIPSEAGAILPNGNSATVNWSGGVDHDYSGRVELSYRISKTDNSCGYSEFSPVLPINLLPKPPITSENNPCAGTSTFFETRAYSNAADYQWNITPTSAGTISNNANTATITWASGFSGLADVTYSVIDATGGNVTSSPVQITVQPLLNPSAAATGPSSIMPWNEATSDFSVPASTTDAKGYQWSITPAEGIVSVTDNFASLTVNWNQQYVGIVNITYQILNNCGWSMPSPVLEVLVQPANPVVEQAAACVGGETGITAPIYQNAISYQWIITPSEAGRITENERQATIHWNNTYIGNVNISYTVTNSAQESYTSPQVQALVRDIPEKPAIASGPDKIFLNHPAVTYQATTTGQSYEWMVAPSLAAEIQNPSAETTVFIWNASHLGKAAIMYRIQNECGWSDYSDSLITQTFKSDELDIPEIFTPNGDGFNDTWDIPAINQYSNAIVRIYNRAKKLMIEFKAAQLPWDGRNHNGQMLESGYYLYQIEIENGRKVLTGFVTILR